MRAYSCVVTWLDKGRFERQWSGGVDATSATAAVGHAVRTAKKKAKERKHGWNEREGSVFRVMVVVGSIIENNGRTEE